MQLYYKTVGGKEIFSYCQVIQMNDGTWVSNPSAAQIKAAGWKKYTPPTPVPTPETEPQFDVMLNAVKRMLDSQVEGLTDEDAIAVAALFPTWISKLGQAVNVGERYWYDGKLWKVIQAHTVQSDWTPDTAVSLFTEVTIEEWPEWKQPQGAHDAYMKGDKVTFNGKHYVSLIDNNVWSPSDLPSGWEEVSNE